MQKLVYLLWKPAKAARDSWCDRLLDECGELLLAQGVLGLTLHLKDSDANVPPPSEGMTGREPPSALLSLSLRNADEHVACEALFAPYAHHYAGYLVEESVYRDHGDNDNGPARDWPDGERSPGVVAVALLERPERMQMEEWVAHWHGVFSPLSESLLSRTRYVRNVVKRVVTVDAPDYAGIVAESFPSRRHICDPYLFYRAKGLSELGERMSKLLLGVTQFLDVPRVQTVIFSEYVLKTARPPLT
jgi:hypothetical protein